MERAKITVLSMLSITKPSWGHYRCSCYVRTPWRPPLSRRLRGLLGKARRHHLDELTLEGGGEFPHELG